MRFYTKQHKYYCGIDLHARSMYVGILDSEGKTLVHQNIKTCRGAFLAVIQSYQEHRAVAVGRIFTWYWIADLCRREALAYVLDHALYMRAIHGGKAKNDKIDSHKIALLLKGGLIRKLTPTSPSGAPPGISCAGRCTWCGSGRVRYCSGWN